MAGVIHDGDNGASKSFRIVSFCAIRGEMFRPGRNESDKTSDVGDIFLQFRETT